MKSVAPRKIFLAILLSLALVQIAPSQGAALDMGVVSPNLPWQQDWKQTIDAIAQTHAKSVRLSFLPNFGTALETVKYARQKGLEVLLSVPLGLKDFYPPNVTPRPGKNGIFEARPLSEIDIDRYESILRKFLAGLDEAGVFLNYLEVGNEINSPGFNGDMPILQKSKAYHTMQDFGQDKDRIINGFRRYGEVVRVTKQLLKSSKLQKQTLLVSAGLASMNEQVPWFVNSGSTVVVPSLMNEIYDTLGFAGLFDARAIHIYPALLKGGKSVSDFVEEGARNCSPHGEKCLVTEWGFNATYNGCSDADPRVPLFSEFVRVARKQQTFKALYLFEWNEGKGFGVFRCNHLSPAGKLLFE